ncbi:MAG: Holliday junction branch migration protein RuvA [Phycisphaerales bacterium]
MITRLAGMLESVEGLEATIRLEGGLWRQVLLPAYLAETLRQEAGKPITLHTLEYLESQGQGSTYIPRLIGFASPQERRFFELLTGVDGFGNRKALRALAHQPALIARAIAGSDAAWLTQLPEIGKKTAEKVILELKGRIAPFLTAAEVQGLDAAAAPPPEEVRGPAAEAIAALVALGETRTDAERRVRLAIARGRALATADQLVAAALGA